jgi:hypothetical protein
VAPGTANITFDKDVEMDKPTLILALAFFFASAPNPDAEAVAEMTANFIVPSNQYNLQASELAGRPEHAEFCCR